MAKKRKKAHEIKLTLENVRCFDGEHRVPIRPLTLLVGENSTGKSTVLAAASMAFDYGFPMRSDFNKPPFQLGTFDTIATYKGGRYGRAGSFSIGRVGVPQAGVSLRATYVSRAGEPVVSAISITDAREGARVVYRLQEGKATVSVQGDGATEREHSFALPGEPPDLASLLLYLWSMASREEDESVAKLLRRLAEQAEPPFLGTASAHRGGIASSAVAMAPIRSKPERTYSEMSSASRPEGGHVPFFLSKLSGGEETGGDEVYGELADFGRSSGLFEEVKPRRFGKKPSDPFQIQVKAGGPAANLVDVGYGVSQALPIVVQTVLAQPHQLVLVQQPEVHLHPRAQAALGSFFVHLVASGHSRLVVETHSDYIIDRVRMEVGAGKLPPEDVLILYFEKEGVESRIYPIHLDKLGNLLDVPRSYRRFFLKERTAFITGKR